jgi:uncharacterized membrane protein HdeD (DUF308 family)
LRAKRNKGQIFVILRYNPQIRIYKFQKEKIMLAAFGRLFNIRQDEWRRLILLTVMLLMFVTGGIWAGITIVAQFLSNLGSENLQYLFIGDAIVIVLTFAIYSSLADRFSNSKILNGLLITGLISIVISLFLINSPNTSISNIAYLVLYMLYRGVTEAISVHWGVYVNDFFDTRAAKRIFTLLGAVVRIGKHVANDDGQYRQRSIFAPQRRARRNAANQRGR